VVFVLVFDHIDIASISTHQYDFVRHAQEPAYQMSHCSLPVNGSVFGLIPAQMAPTLPADMRNPKKQQQFRKHIHKAGQGSECMEEIEQLSDAIHDCKNPFTHQHHCSILLTWSLIMAQKYPHLEPINHWSMEVVLKQAKFYLLLRVSFLALPFINRVSSLYRQMSPLAAVAPSTSKQ
jgi:hypothetical protein